VPAALLTGYANQETAKVAASENIAIMFKPIEIDEFLETTARMMRRDHDQEDATAQSPGLGESGPDESGTRQP
jgi:hypothetical protein